MATPLRVLIVEDSQEDTELLLRELGRAGYSTEHACVETAPVLEAALAERPWDVIISDYHMPRFSAPAALKIVQRLGLDIPFLILSGTVSEEAAVEVMKAGAHDYLNKNNPARLIPAIQRELREAEQRRQRRRAEESLHEAEAKFRALVEESLDGLYVIQNGRWVYVNSSLAEMWGYTREEVMLGKTVLDLIAPSSRPLVAENLRKRVEGEVESISYTLQGIRKDGQIIDIEAHGKRTEFMGKPAVIGVLMDITERRQSERRLAAQYAVTRVLSEVGTLEQAIPLLLQAICENLGWDVGALWHVERQANLIRCAEVWHAPHTTITEFEALSRQTAFPPGVGLPGRVWKSSEPAWIADVATDSNFPRASAAARAGLHGAFGFPIISANEVLSVIEFFSPEIRQPDQPLLQMMAAIGSQIGQFIERQRAEGALRQSEERYRELFENANDIVYTHDLTGNFTSINKAGEQLTGYPREEALRMNISRLVAPEHLEQARKQIGRKVAGETARTTYELEITHKDGHHVAIEVSTRLIHQDGKPIGVQGICRDITERKQAEEEIRKITFFLDSIIENVPIMLFVKDAENLRFERFNKAGEELLGFPREALLGKNDHDLFPKDEADHFIAKDREVLRNKTLLDIPEELIDTNNGTRILHTKKIPILDESANPRHLLGISEDITERKRLEEERDRFFTLSLDMLCIAGFDGYFKRLNPAWHKTLGFTDEELLAKPHIEFVHPDDRQRTATEARRIATGLETHAFENRYLCKDGSYKWLLWNATPFPGQQLIYAVAHDITNRKAAQHQIEQRSHDLEQVNQKLQKRTKQLQQLAYDLQEIARSERQAHDELKKAQSQLVQSEKLAALGQMVAGVAHEINNPLSFVSNNVAVLQRDVKAIGDLLHLYRQGEPILAEREPHLHQRIHELSDRVDLAYTLDNLEKLMIRSRDGLKRIQQIVKDLRDFARLDESDLQEVELNTGIESTINIIQGRAKRQGVTLELDLGSLPRIICYPAKINQVVLNLVANAIDACPQGAKITVRTCAVADGIEIHVIDTGEGIPPAIREKVFDPFFTTKPPGEGTGLGLSISYGIVQDHGGKIDFESEVGRGTHFTIRLPLRPPPRERESA